MIIRQFRVTAASPDEACQNIHAKADIIGSPKIWQAVDGSYECQVICSEEGISHAY